MMYGNHLSLLDFTVFSPHFFDSRNPFNSFEFSFFDLKRAAFYSEENDMTDFGSYTFFIPYLSWCAYRFFLMRYMSYLDRMNFESSNILQFSISFLSIFYPLAIWLNMTPSQAVPKKHGCTAFLLIVDGKINLLS